VIETVGVRRRCDNDIGRRFSWQRGTFSAEQPGS